MFFSRKKNTIGLDVGSHLIKFVEIAHTKPLPKLVNFGVAELIPDAIVEGEIIDRDLVIDTIRGLFETHNLNPKGVAIAVSGRDVIVKKIRMDRMKESEAAEVIRWEADQHIPYDIDDVYMDFQILDLEGDDLQMDVLLVAAKKELIDTQLNLLYDANLEPLIIDVDAFAIQTAFEANYENIGKGIISLVNLGSEVTNINLLKNKIPVLTRDLNIGSVKFREALQKNLSLSLEDAAQTLQGNFPSGLGAPDIKPYIDETGEEVAVGIDRAIDYLQSSGEGERIERIYLSGGGASIPGLKSFLGERLSLPVEIANPLQKITTSEELLVDKPLEFLSPLLMLAIGLGLRTLN